MVLAVNNKPASRVSKDYRGGRYDADGFEASCLCPCVWPPRWPPARTRADDYPSHPIRLIVPYAAGGGADSVARILAKRVGDSIGQTIVIENRGGAGSIIGTELVSKSNPDGYTLLLGQSGPISINPAIYEKLPYDPLKDFTPVCMTTAYPYIMVVNPGLGVTTLQEFVALARSRPGELNYGTTGVGAANHLVTELFDSKAGIKMTHIPYRGTALAVTDLIAGHVQCRFRRSNFGAAAHQRRHAARVGGHQQGALACRTCRADDCRERLSRLRRSRLARNPGTGEYAACHHREAQYGDREGAQKPGNQVAAGKAGDADHRQFAGSLRQFHQAGHRNLEGSGGAGQDRGEVGLSLLIVRELDLRNRPADEAGSAPCT